jgi:AcrR family transcriptional regulator
MVKGADMNETKHENQIPKTKKQILLAAADVFAQNGYAGARMDEIAKRAAVNKATIYYHLGGKDALYRITLENVFSEIADRIETEAETKETPEQKMKSYIRIMTASIERHPHMAPIMQREMAAGGINLPESAAKEIVRIVAALSRILEEGKKEGVFAEAIPFIVHLMVTGSAILFKVSTPFRKNHPAIPETVKNLEERMGEGAGEEIEKIVLNGLLKTVQEEC